MRDLKSFIIAFILVATFSLLIITIGLQIQEDNGGEQTLAGQDAVSKVKTKLDANLTDITTISKSSSKNFWEDIPIIGTGVIFMGTIFGVGRLIFDSTILLWDSTIGFIAVMIGIPSWIIGVLGAIIIILGIFWAYKMLQTGE